jgi:aminoglycoside/choline kinase family phosphotransferase
MKEIIEFLHQYSIDYSRIEPLPLSGGDRKYYRIYLQNSTQILTTSEDVKENITFFSFTNTLQKAGIAVPQLGAICADNKIYIQQDLGGVCLLDKVLQEGYTASNFELYKTVVHQLAKINVSCAHTIDYNLCLASKKFDTSAVLFDLNYCLAYFIKPMQIIVDEPLLAKEFDALSTEIGNITPHYFMYRDCQGRNIMIHQNIPYFIDYQGGMQGPLGYDLASLLWQAKAQLPLDWKQKLTKQYITALNELLPTKLDVAQFDAMYNKIILMRLLQVLGAYGRRGLLEKKQHFLDSIPAAIENIKHWMQLASIQYQSPALHVMLLQIIEQKS